MRVYTSYYKKFEMNPGGRVPVRISTSKPEWFRYRTEDIPELYPGWELVNAIKNGFIEWEEYEAMYKTRFETLSREDIWEKLKQISDRNDGRDLVLLCYETPRDDCHRHIVAEYLGPEVVELE